MSNYKDPPPPYSEVPEVHQHITYIQPTAPRQQPYAEPPGYGATETVIIQPEVAIIGACPACLIGVLEDDYSCLGVLCAIVFFPLGILCCLLLKERRCKNCGARFGR